MFSVPTEAPAKARARWLAELSQALNDAYQLLIALDIEHDQRLEAQELFLRIEAARFEIQSLRLSRSLSDRKEMPPEWSELLPWRRNARDAD